MLFTFRLKRLLIVAVVLIIANCPKYCSTLKNPFYGLTLHGSIGLGIKPSLLSESKSSASSFVPHYHYPFGPYHPTKARYPSPSINLDGRYTHLLQRLQNSRSDVDIFGYRPVKHYWNKSNYDSSSSATSSGMDFLLKLLRGGTSGDDSSTSNSKQEDRYYASKNNNSNSLLSSLAWKEFSQSAYPRPLRQQHHGSKNTVHDDSKREYSHHNPTVDHEFKGFNPFSMFSHFSSEHSPSIYQHPLLQIVPLLVIEKRHRIRPGYGGPPSHPPSFHPSPHAPPSFHPHPEHSPPQLPPQLPFDHPHHHFQHQGPPPRFKQSKINFPIDDAPPLPAEIRVTTSKFRPFPSNDVGQQRRPLISPHIRPFIVAEPFVSHNNGGGGTRPQHQEKSIFPTTSFDESHKNNEVFANYDGQDYHDIITATNNNNNDGFSQIKFPHDGSSSSSPVIIEGGGNSLFSYPNKSFRNSHQYSPTTGPDQDLSEGLSPLLLMGAESKRVPDNVVANSTRISALSSSESVKGTAKLERRIDDDENNNVISQLQKNEFWLDGKHVQIPDFTPIPIQFK